jgi:tetratricopeptide (TPR) repeat protein
MVGMLFQPVFVSWKSVAFCALAIALSALPIRAQKGGSGGGSHGSTGGAMSGPSSLPPFQPALQPGPVSGVVIPTTQPMQKPAVVEDESCFSWDLAQVRGATVSAVRLGVPAKARSQYEKACDALKKNKLDEAEQHVRDAIQKYPKYPAAWVMLGQILQDEQKMDEAHEACSQPITVDPTYLPPYLCLAELLNLERKWDDLAAWSDRFLGMNLTGDMYANYYRGLALFHLHNLPEAQKYALKTIALDTEHHQAAFFFLLAQIYGEQGDVADASAQIEQFVKFSRSQQDKDAAKEYLSELQSQQSAK